MLCFEVGVLKWSPQRKCVHATVRLVLPKRTLGWSSGRNVEMKVKVKRGRAGNKRKVNSRILEIIHIGPRRFMVKYLPWKYVQIFQKFIIKTQPIRILISELLWGWKTISLIHIQYGTKWTCPVWKVWFELPPRRGFGKTYEEVSEVLNCIFF